MGELKDVSLFFADTCPEAMYAVEKRACPFHPDMELPTSPANKEKDCCNDTTEILKLDQTFSISFHDLSFGSTTDFSPFILLKESIDFHLRAPVKDPKFLHLKPPLLPRNTQGFLQVFLC